MSQIFQMLAFGNDFAFPEAGASRDRSHSITGLSLHDYLGADTHPIGETH
jgi:hypothetical protein